MIHVCTEVLGPVMLLSRPPSTQKSSVKSTSAALMPVFNVGIRVCLCPAQRCCTGTFSRHPERSGHACAALSSFGRLLRRVAVCS